MRDVSLVSMTGFGRADQEAPFGKILIEIQSVNRKFLEISISLPKEWFRFEQEMRKKVAERVLRGSVSVRVQISLSHKALQTSLPDPKKLRALKESWEALAGSIGYSKEAIDFPFLIASFEDSSGYAVQESDLVFLLETLDRALQDHSAMRLQEGRHLAADMEARLKRMETLLTSVERRSPDASAKMRQKLKERMEALFSPSVELDDRLLKEVALFSERVDISEEIVRLKSHFAQYEEMKKKGGAAGRGIDFLIQEMGREINTIGAKSVDAEIAHAVIEMKSELEKIREQVQNIE
jgi:uncharacterized protein (TIGR00255 family)